MVSLNTTEKEQHHQSAKDLGKKMKREAVLVPKLRSQFKKVSNKFVTQYKYNASLPDLQDHKDDVRNILHKNYKVTASQFNKQIRESIGYPSNDDEIQDRIDTATNHNAVKTSYSSADDIADTTYKNMRNAVKISMAASLVAGIALSKDDIADQSKTILDAYFNARVPTIATTEVQRASESGKFEELNGLINGNAYYKELNIHEVTKKKTWIAIMDEHTREDHVEADGQEVDFEDPFDVGDEQLMTPGDDSLGATAKNICNCRCNAIYTIEKSESDSDQDSE